jgi:Ca2+-binding EF-hand superfamily protein
MRFACLLLLFAASTAAAQEASVRFLILDLNGDGYLSLSEAAGIGDVVERFDRADADRDGYLSAREFDRLERMRVRTVTTRRERVRTSVARDARAAEREEAASAEAAPSAAAGASR